MELERAPDVVIVGGGVIGIMAAYELARRGVRPVVLERARTPFEGCSSGNAGLIAAGHCFPLAMPSNLKAGLRYMFVEGSPFSFKPTPRLIPWMARYVSACRPRKVDSSLALVRDLATRSLEMHAQLADTGLDTGFERRGVVNAYETERAFDIGCAEARTDAGKGLRVDILSPADARGLEPRLGEHLVGATHYRDEAHCDPKRFLQAMTDAAVDKGSVVAMGVEVLRMESRRGRVTALHTSAGVIRPGTVVVAAGVWTRALAAQLGCRIPIEGGKGYHVDLRNPEPGPHIPIYLHEARVIVTPLGGTIRLAGTLQLSGLDDSVDLSRVEAVLSAGLRHVSGLERGRVTEVWRGLRPCTPDGVPVIGRAGATSNVIFAAGHGMMGLHLAPVTADLVARSVFDEHEDLRPLSPRRFRSPWPDRAAA